MKPALKVNSLQLKIIAMCSMLLDHAAVALPFFRLPENEALYLIMRGIGRLAFPLYAFLLALGAEKTKSLTAYLLRLIMMALISEIPFDLMNYQKPFAWEGQNVFFTLSLGLLAIYIYRAARERWGDKPLAYSGLFFLPAAAGAAHLLNFDYGTDGIILIFGLYLWRTEYKQDKAFPFYLAAVMLLLWHQNPLQWLAFLAVPLMYFYNGDPAPKSLKPLFYLFYPLHLLLLAVIR